MMIFHCYVSSPEGTVCPLSISQTSSSTLCGDKSQSPIPAARSHSQGPRCKGQGSRNSSGSLHLVAAMPRPRSVASASPGKTQGRRAGPNMACGWGMKFQGVGWPPLFVATKPWTNPPYYINGCSTSKTTKKNPTKRKHPTLLKPLLKDNEILDVYVDVQTAHFVDVS